MKIYRSAPLQKFNTRVDGRISLNNLQNNICAAGVFMCKYQRILPAAFPIDTTEKNDIRSIIFCFNHFKEILVTALYKRIVTW